MKKAFSIALDDKTIEQLRVLQERYALPDRNSTIVFAINGAYLESKQSDRRFGRRHDDELAAMDDPRRQGGN